MLQYGANANGNTHRLAFSTSQHDVANNKWSWIDFRPANFGLAATGLWLDFPDLSVSDNFLYHTANVY